MGRPYGHQYQSALSSSTGTMVCAACNKAIVVGEYRSYMRSKSYDWAYVVHHRDCCADDPQWAKRDRAKGDGDKMRAAQLADAIAFRDKWDCADLDELIDSLAPADPDEEARAERAALDRREREAVARREKAEHDAKLAQVAALKKKLGLPA